MSTLTIRSATPADLPTIEKIEIRCFSVSRRSSRRALKHSLTSASQSVWVAEDHTRGNSQIAGAMTLHHRLLSIRIYSVAVLPAFRRSGVGRQMVKHAITLAQRTGRSAVTLEADRRNRTLTGWYETFGFETLRVLKDYYSQGRHAVRMRMELNSALKGGRVRGCS
jgi:ribosomal protein S18 acetylase RimI-like enzyme